MRPVFQLGERLSACANFVPIGATLADIGTDHAYLPIWLLKMDRIRHAIAMDVREGPLMTAQENARRYQVEDHLEIRRSNGLDQLTPNDANCVVIAGMGGELMLEILGNAREAGWFDREIQWIFQPMRAADLLRLALPTFGLYIQEEVAVIDHGKPYSVMSVQKGFEFIDKTSLYAQMGKIKPGTEASFRYAQQVSQQLNYEIRRVKHAGDMGEYTRLMDTLSLISNTYLQRKEEKTR